MATKKTKSRKGSPPKKVSVSGIPPEVVTAARTLVNWVFSLLGPPRVGDPLPEVPSCCESVCANTPAGKKYLVICDGTTMKTLVGTQDGQYPAWDQTAGTWILTTV